MEKGSICHCGVVLLCRILQNWFGVNCGLNFLLSVLVACMSKHEVKALKKMTVIRISPVFSPLLSFHIVLLGCVCCLGYAIWQPNGKQFVINCGPLVFAFRPGRLGLQGSSVCLSVLSSDDSIIHHLTVICSGI